MKKRILFHISVALTILFVIVSCKEEEKETAKNMAGVWETTDALFERTFRGEKLTTTKTIFQFYSEREGLTVGYGVAVEYYNHTLLPVSYHNIKWETWTRQDGSVGIEVDYQETDDKFKTTEYVMEDEVFNGQCTINNIPGTRTFAFKRTSAPDVSKVWYWGYNELIPTWKTVTYEGELGVERGYKGQIYKPTSVVITFDIDPSYNTGKWRDKAYIMEKYENAPWGSYLADSLSNWTYYRNNDNTMRLMLTHDGDSSWGDYKIDEVKATEEEITGKLWLRTNEWGPCKLKRVQNPDWSKVTQWGILNRIKQ